MISEKMKRIKEAGWEVGDIGVSYIAFNFSIFSTGGLMLNKIGKAVPIRHLAPGAQKLR